MYKAKRDSKNKDQHYKNNDMIKWSLKDWNLQGLLILAIECPCLMTLEFLGNIIISNSAIYIYMVEAKG